MTKAQDWVIKNAEDYSLGKETAYTFAERAYDAGVTENAPKWHKIFVASEPYSYEYWELPQETLPKNGNFYFVKLKNGFIKICELKYDCWSKKKYFYDLHGGKQSDVAEWLEYPDIQGVKEEQ